MQDISTSFKKSIISSDVKDIAIDYSEIAIDKIIDNDVLSEIPIVKSLLAVYKVGISIKERYTIKKMLKFLIALEEIPEKEKSDFLNKLSKNDKYSNDFLEKLLVILERLDDLEKATIIGNLFKATIKGEVKMLEFTKLSSIVDRSFIQDLKVFCLREGNKEIKESEKELIFTFQKMQLECGHTQPVSPIMLKEKMRARVLKEEKK